MSIEGVPRDLHLEGLPGDCHHLEDRSRLLRQAHHAVPQDFVEVDPSAAAIGRTPSATFAQVSDQLRHEIRIAARFDRDLTCLAVHAWVGGIEQRRGETLRIGKRERPDHQFHPPAFETGGVLDGCERSQAAAFAHDTRSVRSHDEQARRVPAAATTRRALGAIDIAPLAGVDDQTR